MLNHAIALMSFCSFHGQEAPTAKSLIDRMLAHYHGAKSLTGSIKLTVSARQGSAGLNSAVQFERPAKFYLFQQKTGANPDPESPTRWLVTSDGSMFSYSVPNDRFHAAPTLRLVEPVKNPRVRFEHTVATIYGASSKSIGDRCMPLDIAIAAKEDMVFRIGQWATKEVRGTTTINNRTAYLIEGSFRPYPGAQVVGTFQMSVTVEGDLLRYREVQHVSVDGVTSEKITSQWDVSLTVNGKIDPALFRVITR